MRALQLIPPLLVAFLLGCQTAAPPQPYSRPPIRKGVATVPASLGAVSGRYYRTLGCSVLYLNLAEDGTYFAELDGLARGESRGHWKLDGGRIAFSLPDEKTMATLSLAYFAPLEVLWSETDWVLLSSAEADRKYYDEYGVSGQVCFVKRKQHAQ
jgi:hypothetical protein